MKRKLTFAGIFAMMMSLSGCMAPATAEGAEGGEFMGASDFDLDNI